MHFPLSGAEINPLFLASVGFVVGVLGGFFGVGGGFLAGPMMFLVGVPMNYVVGTDLAHMVGKSIVAAKQHRALGHVDLKLGFIMVGGTMTGVELGAQIVVRLHKTGVLDTAVGTMYVLLLFSIAIFSLWESTRALRMIRGRKASSKDAVGFQAVYKRLQALRIPPMISLPASGIESISLWAIIGVGLATGLLAGMLGVGGGFIRMPALVYVLGIPTHVAVGTDLFEIVISSSYGTLTHALKGNVDIFIALVMHTGAALGAQIGARSTRFVGGPKIRLAFSVLPLIGAGLMLQRLLGGGGIHF